MKKKGVLSSLPASIKVGPLVYEFLLVPKGTLTDCWGDCDDNNQKITIERGHRRDRTINVVIHEVLHACWASADLPERASEEKAVTCLTNTLQQVLRDNDKFRGWFRTEVCGE